MTDDPTRTRHSLAALQPLRELAERQRDDLQRSFEATLRALERTEQQAAQLSGYRHETQQRWQAEFRSGAAIALVHCYHDFVARLHGAEAHSDSGVQAARARAASARESLRAAEQRLAGVERLIERREAALGLGLMRREQRTLDEAAARASLRARGAEAAFGPAGCATHDHAGDAQATDVPAA